MAKHVYLLESLSRPGERYVGVTVNLRARLQDHNAGRSPQTRQFALGSAVAIWFEDDRRAEEFEQYLKHGSGHAFASRHFWPRTTISTASMPSTIPGLTHLQDGAETL